MSSFEDEYLDVLMNLEMALISSYRENEEMVDWNALNVVNALIRVYTAELRGRNEPTLKLDEIEELPYDRAYIICEFHVGRGELATEDGEPIGLIPDAISVDELLQCLKRIRKSIELWRKEGGVKGYFNFVNNYLPGTE